MYDCHAKANKCWDAGYTLFPPKRPWTVIFNLLMLYLIIQAAINHD